MSNDPDLIEKLYICTECEGDGGWFQDLGAEYGSIFVNCASCSGAGEVSL